ncbi:ATP-dependent zinc metalloprotease FtsH [Moorella thermoacetica]|uniref:ATP-dependent zinc metalloprotease FtsH n=1 Tax=Moorella thermoacetica (strain ATCC 39073 / JCM 9320) TaxID=264732 RepID=Q2RM95_MOOTA|nr:ATP-dependent zinc metalloprotease FtsH [Moorella thermoacetica]AKX95487.1 ATP-dependent zinc metalloprotease FtsH [Moorella thermoacetica]OIQ56943.1 ATP-dependent zinc metalloprotease FtsH [Moorella thermoacetica]OIQ62250.1 ATP-dependent zinc metalloprotease FtsH [Moorella thermoacetica]TYL09055.1 ATP-dependent zinc metalloprotease FtsH [Moorella thermoacetica]TYL16139.1 ATP-dependent zinc metalloprotease FtsH [Moorella thermoacetica]
MNRIFKNLAIYLLIVLLAVSVIRLSTPPEKPAQEWDLTRFYQAVDQDQVREVTLTPQDNIIKVDGVLKDNTKFTVNALSSTPLTDRLISKGVRIKTQPSPQPPWWTSLLGSLLPILLLVGLVFFMMQQTQGGGSRVMQFGKSRARLHTDDKRKVTFEDVAGADEVKEELEEVVEFLKNPRKFNELGARIPKGVLLFGPPGTGKTLLARAVAGEAGVPFFSISGSDFVEMFVGVGASRVRDLFEQAKKNSPCIVFIDEIDAVGRQRGAGLGGGHDEREQTLNQLLVEMDGFNANEGIIIIAATNRPDILDPALLRPGRFDRQIVVDIPDVNGRKDILKVHVRGKPLDETVDLDVLARRTPGFTGADLANLVNEAALLAARRGKHKISMEEMEDSIERVIAGPEKKSRVISDYEKRLVAFHEAGHALLGHYLPHTDPLHKVSIIPRGRAGGYTLLLPKEDRRYMTKSQIIDQVTMLLGGRVAEALVLKEISTGAQNDLERATELVRKMITEFGMSEELGPLTFGRRQETVFLGRDIARDRNYSEAVAFSIDKEARHIIDECYNRAKEMLQKHLAELHLVARALMEKETLEAEEFTAIIEAYDREHGVPENSSDAGKPAAAGGQDTGKDTPGNTLIKLTFLQGLKGVW